MARRSISLLGVTLLAVSLLRPSIGFAVDLTVDQTAKVFMPDGKTVKKICAEDDGVKCVKFADVTIGSAIQMVLTMPIPNDPDNGKAGMIAFLLYGKDRPAIKHEDSLLILRRADKINDPVVIGRIREALSPGIETGK